MDPVRYGVIGLGQVSVKGHIPNLLALPEAKIVAVADVVPAALAAAKQAIGGVRTYSEPKQLLTDKDVEAVVVAAPNWLHKELAVAALDAGKHVLCEKPLGIDLAECDAILAAQRKSGKILQVGHEMRYQALTRAIREKIQQGLIGKVQMMLLQEFRFPLFPGWRQTGKTGGVMLEKNSHYFDIFNWMAGSEPERVVGVGGNNVNKESPLIDHCVVTVEYKNKVRAALVMCLFGEHGPLTSDCRFEVVGDKGRLVAYEEEQRLVLYRRDKPEPEQWTLKDEDVGGWHSGFMGQHRAFIRCIRQGEKVLSDGAEARKTMAVALAAERAVASETVVPLG